MPVNPMRTKKLFLVLAALFIALLVWFSIDFGRKTTFPGSKPQLLERIGDQYGLKRDSTGPDSTPFHAPDGVGKGR